MILGIIISLWQVGECVSLSKSEMLIAMLIPIVVISLWWYASALLSKGDLKSLIISLVMPVAFWLYTVDEVIFAVILSRSNHGMVIPGFVALVLIATALMTIAFIVLLTVIIVKGIILIGQKRRELSLIPHQEPVESDEEQ